MKLLAQNLIPCPDGTMADPTVGCVNVPGGIVNPESSVLQLILNFANVLMAVAAGVAVAALIYGAIRYSLALGNDEKIEEAKRILFYATFGLVIALIARYVVGFLIDVLI